MMNSDNKKLHVALGIVVGLILLLSIFTFGWVLGEEEKTNTNQILVVNNLKNIDQNEVQKQTELPKLDQSSREQERQNVETTHNNIEINIHDSHYHGTRYYGSSSHYYNPYRTRYYNGYHPYYRHGFAYSTSWGNGFNYRYY